ncbi:hypothetical protein ACLI4Q_12210 [Natrialbaceae archaeon A-CW1-1]
MISATERGILLLSLGAMCVLAALVLLWEYALPVALLVCGLLLITRGKHRP